MYYHLWKLLLQTFEKVCKRSAAFEPSNIKTLQTLQTSQTFFSLIHARAFKAYRKRVIYIR